MGVVRLNSKTRLSEKFINFNADQSVIATGGDVTLFSQNGKFYKVHRFTSSGTFQVQKGSADFEYIVVAGGGGAGREDAIERATGGAGAGGLKTGTLTLSEGDYTVTIGSKGLGRNTNGAGTAGTSSAFHTVSCTGGGQSAPSANGSSGGSGGGGAGQTATSGGTGVSGEGNNGGNGGTSATGTFRTGGGGGGKGSAGANGVANGAPGKGGDAYDASTFLGQTAGSTFLAGGGAGNRYTHTIAASIGGNGVGGTGSNHRSTNAVNAVEFTGSGGGTANSPTASGDGADGVVYIKYEVK
jgi:hypothetical protein